MLEDSDAEEEAESEDEAPYSELYPFLSGPVRKAAKKSWKNPTIDNDGTRDSPNGTGLLSESPNSFGDSPRDRSHVHKCSYAQRIRDKERDYRSPRERERPRDSDRRNNNDRGSTKENTQLVGDWEERVNSSGKFFYYNCKSKVSQWEKPRDWVDWEKDKEKERDRRDRDRERKLETEEDQSGDGNSAKKNRAKKTKAEKIVKNLPSDVGGKGNRLKMEEEKNGRPKAKMVEIPSGSEREIELDSDDEGNNNQARYKERPPTEEIPFALAELLQLLQAATPGQICIE